MLKFLKRRLGKIVLPRFDKKTAMILLLAVALAVVSFLYVKTLMQAKSIVTDEEIVKKVRMLMVIPQEAPEVTTVDFSKLPTLQKSFPDFYQNVSVGDKVIQFPDRAILYRVNGNKILNVAVGNRIFNASGNRLSVEIRYEEGEEKRVMGFVAQIFPILPEQYKIEKILVSKVSYPDDVVYVVHKGKEDLVNSFAEFIGNSPIVENLEKDEAPTSADVIVSFKKVPQTTQ